MTGSTSLSRFVCPTIAFGDRLGIVAEKCGLEKGWRDVRVVSQRWGLLTTTPP